VVMLSAIERFDVAGEGNQFASELRCLIGD
jgi:hypothetical protein